MQKISVRSPSGQTMSLIATIGLGGAFLIVLLVALMVSTGMSLYYTQRLAFISFQGALVQSNAQLQKIYWAPYPNIMPYPIWSPQPCQPQPVVNQVCNLDGLPQAGISTSQPTSYSYLLTATDSGLHLLNGGVLPGFSTLSGGSSTNIFFPGYPQYSTYGQSIFPQYSNL